MEGSKASGGEEATQVLADILIMFSVNSIVWWPQIKHWRGDDDSVRWHNFIKDRGLQGQLFLGSLADISTFRCYQRKSNLSSVSHFWTKEGKNAATLKCPSRWQKAGEKERRTRSSRVVLWRRVMWSSVVDHACTCSCAFLTPLTRWRAELRTHTFVCSFGWRVADACVPAVCFSRSEDVSKRTSFRHRHGSPSGFPCRGRIDQSRYGAHRPMLTSLRGYSGDSQHVQKSRDTNGIDNAWCRELTCMLHLSLIDLPGYV